jgi:RNA polymerase sigma-70 factor (ECF subfamily)
MLRDTTFQDLNRERTLDEAAELVMDEESFRAFYDRTARGIWAYLVRVTGDRTLAEDLLQETFYRFLRARASYESESHRRNSLYRIATNLAVDARRRSVTRGEAAIAGHEIERVAARDGAATELTTDVTRALSQLKPRERAMLWLAYAEGASHREIAESLGLSPGSLKPMLFRARRKLAELLGRGKA